LPRVKLVRFWDPHPFVRLVRIIQSEVVIDGLGGKDGRKALREWLQTVERAVAAHTNQAFDTLVFVNGGRSDQAPPSCSGRGNRVETQSLYRPWSDRSLESPDRAG
jgi:hypothetical protein